MYAGKYKNNISEICAAGKPMVQHSTVADSLKEYSLVDKIDALKYDARINERKLSVPYGLPKMVNHQNRGIYTGVRSCLHTPVPTRFQSLMNDFKESTYSSYWHRPLGTCRDPTPGLPAGMDYRNTTFGVPTEFDDTKDLINPAKSAYEVLVDSQINHEQYKKSFNDYNPGERINRQYVSPPYHQDLCNGHAMSIDPMGSRARCSMMWGDNGAITCGSKTRADSLKWHRRRVGKCWEPNENIKCVSEGHAFGEIVEKPFHGMAELLKPDAQSRLEKRDVLMWFGSLNKLKLKIKRKTDPTFDLYVLLNRMTYLDKEKTGFISLDNCFAILEDHELLFNRKHIESLMRYMKIVQCDKVDYKKFVEALGPDIKLAKKMNDIPPEKLNYITTANAANLDRYVINNTDIPRAGIPPPITDSQRPPVRYGRVKVDGENITSDTVQALIRGSVFFQYGLSHKDFFLPRTREFIRKLFGKIGYDFTPEAFDELWRTGLEIDERQDEVCVDTFYNLVKQHTEPLVKLVDELECREKRVQV